MSKGYVAAQAHQARTVVARIKPGQEIVATITQILQEYEIKSAYIPTFLGGFKKLKLGSMKASNNEDRPKDIITEYNDPFDYFGTGTVALHDGKLALHIHLTAAGGDSRGITGHLFYGEVVFLAELVIVELSGVAMVRKENPEVFDMPLLDFA